MLKAFQIFAILSINIALISCQCTTVRTSGGTKTPERCKFPFRFKGRIFQSCTDFEDPDGKEWCSVETNSRGNHIQGQGRWGHCDQRKCSNANSNTTPKSVTSNSGQEQCLTVNLYKMSIVDNVFNFSHGFRLVVVFQISLAFSHSSLEDELLLNVQLNRVMMANLGVPQKSQKTVDIFKEIGDTVLVKMEFVANQIRSKF